MKNIVIFGATGDLCRRKLIPALVDLGVPAPVITTALYERFNSRNLGTFAAKILNGMRYMFGGHHVR